ncbi:hypothetical protein [Antarctobacter jejuensis]|uniref:hypothetical protein n=1 Tax=Antarctobacter jejuensis TaxID=1439938 RepID=UPI003FD14F5F
MGFLTHGTHEASTRVTGQDGSVVLHVMRLDSGTRILVGCPEGYLTRTDLTEVMTRIVEEPILGASLPTLWDFRGHDFVQYSPSEFRSHAFLMQRFPERIGVKRAYLVDSSVGYGTLRMFQGTMSGFNLEQQEMLMVSYDAEELIAWLCADA